MRVVHLTSVHPWRDTRIFLKMCRSLAAAGHEVHLVAPGRDFPSPAEWEGVTLHAVRPAGSRWERMLVTSRRVFAVGAELGGEVYHFHDPEGLAWAAGWQERLGRGFVYDAHEDYRLDILDKGWLPAPVRGPVARRFGGMEDAVAGKLAGIVAATPAIARRFAGLKRVAVVNNFALPGEAGLPGGPPAAAGGPPAFIYAGAIAPGRGVAEMLAALARVPPPARLGLAGAFASPAFRGELSGRPGWERVDVYGFLGREELARKFSGSVAGLLLYGPAANNLQARPTKLFEYMAAGLPVIASDFPGLREIIEGNACGLLVDPGDPAAIAAAMREVLADPARAREMGRRGRRAVATQYNWEGEFPKLLELYEAIINHF